MPIRELMIDTSRGPSRAIAHLPRGPRASSLVVALHGAGTDTSRSPLPELCDELVGFGIAAVRFDQPYRVAGRRAPDAAHFLDRVLIEAFPHLRRFARAGAPVAMVGRSSGARVACRMAGELGIVAVACLGFPYQPPARKGGTLPADRGAELLRAAATCRVLIVQGSRDGFGMPPAVRGTELVVEPGAGHVPTLAMAQTAAAWLGERLGT